jgi:hypothetical protein
MAGNSSEEWTNLRCWWFGSVYEIADIEYQRRTWLTPPDNSPHWQYVEFCCSYPGADQLKFALERGHLNSKEYDLLTSLGEAISSHRPSNPYDSRAILEDPSWHAVVARAEQVRQELFAVTENAVERSYLANHFDNSGAAI